MSERTSSRPRSWRSHIRTDRLISTSWRQRGPRLGELELLVGDQALVGDRLEARRDLAGQLLGLLEVTRGPAEQEPEDEDLGADGAGEERAELEQVDVGQLDDQLGAEDEGHPGCGGDEQPRVAPEHVSGHERQA